MALKLDNLWKHGDKRKVSFVILKVCTTHEYYTNKESTHANNEHLYVIDKKDTINNQVFHVEKRKKKLASRFSIHFHMLFEGRPLTNCENMKKLLHFFNVKNFPKTQLVGRWHLACTSWLLAKPKLWLRMLGSFSFHVMK
jgi:hypothetical protein